MQETVKEEIKTEKAGPNDELVQKLFELGAHFGFSRRRRHPSVRDFVYGYKNNSAIIDLEKTTEAFEKACDFVKELGSKRAVILFVGNKPEARLAVKKAAADLSMPFVAERWIGGTLTNFKQIKSRVNRLKWLKEAEQNGELAKYTKKERLLLSKERKNLERYFEGISDLEKMPDALFAVDLKEEEIAVAEAKQKKIPIITISNSDCDIRDIDYPVIANDTSKATISFFTEKLSAAYKEGLKQAPAPKVEEKDEVKTDKGQKEAGEKLTPKS